MKRYIVVFSFTAMSYWLIAINSSCVKGSTYAKETRMLDSLQTQVQRADSSVKTMDSAKLFKTINHIALDLQLLKMDNVDSMGEGATEILRNYSSVRYALLTDYGRRRPLLNELEKSQVQLSALSHDLKNKLIKEDSVQLYVGFEAKKATELVGAASQSVSDVKTQMPLFDMITPQADSLVARVKENKKI